MLYLRPCALATALLLAACLAGPPSFFDSSSSSGQCPMEEGGEAGECSMDGGAQAQLPRHKTVKVFNNGVSEGGVEMTIDAGESMGEVARMMAAKVDANATLLPHQADYGVGAPWRVYREDGHVVRVFEDLRDGEHVYVVPSGLHFMWPTREIGHTVVLDDIKTKSPKPIQLKTLNHSPKVFEIENLLTEEEAEQLKQASLSVKHNGNKLQRSTTGHTGNVDPMRTSDNAFISSESPLAMELIDRAFQVLRMKTDMALADGLQVLRYNESAGYRWHTDWFPEKTAYGRNHDVTRGGSNRLATILFFLSDVELGGQTGFPEAPGDTSQLNHSMSLAQDMFGPGSWELEAVQKCFGRFSVKPRKARAILFYSLKPNGQGDPMSMHTGCPVLLGQKWAANLWVWNKNRDDHRGNRRRVSAEFVNRMEEPTLVSWVTNPRHIQGRIDPGKTMPMSTFDGDSFVFRDLTRTKVGGWVVGRW